jgi:hypothetical protein
MPFQLNTKFSTFQSSLVIVIATVRVCSIEENLDKQCQVNGAVFLFKCKTFEQQRCCRLTILNTVGQSETAAPTLMVNLNFQTKNIECFLAQNTVHRPWRKANERAVNLTNHKHV